MRRHIRQLSTPALRHVPAVIAVAGLAFSACTTQGGGSPAATGTSGSAGGPTVATASSELGTYLTGPDGKTLYVLTKDTANTSTCTASCANTWPPFTLAAGQKPQAGGGVTGQLGTLTRSDGATQVSYNGLPLYHFMGDAKAGDTNGQGVGGVWFVAGAAGGPGGSGAPGSSAASAPPGGYDY
jgi:predicted lipoprotein with Yx(FWY)xxD motif